MNPGTSGKATVAEALRAGLTSGLPRLEAEWLLLHALGHGEAGRAWLIAHDTDALDTDALARYQGLCTRRLQGEPVAYLLGQRGFHGLTLLVDARVLDPRPDTETLVDWALEVLHDRPTPAVLDLGTGSGAIALAVQYRRPDARVWALDASADALDVARANASRLDLPVSFAQGHWLRGWPPTASESAPTRFDLIVSNPPYIRADDPHLAALTHEPLSALASGPDGLDDLREIVATAGSYLKPGGWLLLEHGWDQADAVAALLSAQGYADVAHRLDLGGHRRCTGGRWPDTPHPNRDTPVQG